MATTRDTTPGAPEASPDAPQELVQLGRRTEVTRRDLLSLMGFSLGAAGLAACRAPVQHAIPLPVASAELMPGVARRYATTCGGCASACPLVVKQRDGRPIKVEGNTESPLFGGGTCATGQATVLSLYDDERLRGPTWDGRPVAWEEIDRHVRDGLATARAEGEQIVLLSGTTPSPSWQKLVHEWRRAFPASTFRYVVYDAVSASALRAAYREAFGKAMVPHHRFDRARVIVGLDADFLGTWLSPVEFAHQYAKGRTTDARRSFHAQCEPGLSVTGSNADLRLAVPPSHLGLVALHLLADVVRRLGAPPLEPGPALSVEPAEEEKLALIAEALWRHRGESLVVSGSNDVATQSIVVALNELLGNVGVGKPVDLSAASLQRQGDDTDFEALVDDMNRGLVHTLIMRGVNPAYDAAIGPRFVEGLGRVPLSISLADRRDETSAHVRALCPDHHFLESWGDAEPIQHQLSLTQPLIAPLHDTRAAAESLLAWLGRPSDPYAFLRAFWESSVFPRRADDTTTFEDFWERALESGVATLRPRRHDDPPVFRGDWRRAARAIADQRARAERDGHASAYELHLHESVALRDGRHANNPWLQELPDPITKVTWGNVAAVAPRTAAALGLAEGDVVSLRTARGQVELPVFVQPGQDARTISVALGYGRTRVGRAGNGVGINMFPLAPVVDGFAGGARRASAPGVELVATGRRTTLAGTQTHFSLEGRPIDLETSLEARAPETAEAPEALPSLWAERPRGAHRWGMAVDLDKCTGCSACVVACQAENNIPVVGADQVRRGRSMHWIRIDRYYAGSEAAPTTVHQPMMCQHCEHAPCETVCPVLATTTSSEGLNQQVYNRCIGTRYCANNCPYKVRRFNWYDYTEGAAAGFPLASPLGRLALNPDVTVRTRGVMEKCSLCVQRINQGKNEALQRREPLRDGDVRTACQEVCPTGAITFGDLADPNSHASRLLADRRAMRVLEELGTRPNVAYLKRVRS